MKRLYIQQKWLSIEDHYEIYDENEQVAYYVDEEFHFLKKTFFISDKNNNHVFTVEKVPLSLLPIFTVEFTNGKCLEFQSRFRIFSKRIDILPEEEGLVIEGDFLSKTFDVLKNNEYIGSVDRALLTIGDVYEITINKEEYQDLMVAVMIAVDVIIDASKNS